MELNTKLVEGHLRAIIEEFSNKIGLASKISNDTCPYDIGISSQLLISVMVRLEDMLKINIPENCYIFYEKKTHSQLTIKEAANKLIEIIK